MCVCVCLRIKHPINIVLTYFQNNIKIKKRNNLQQKYKGNRKKNKLYTCEQLHKIIYKLLLKCEVKHLSLTIC